MKTIKVWELLSEPNSPLPQKLIHVNKFLSEPYGQIKVPIEVIMWDFLPDFDKIIHPNHIHSKFGAPIELVNDKPEIAALVFEQLEESVGLVMGSLHFRGEDFGLEPPF